MTTLARVVRYLFALLLILHGFAHIPGVLGSWKLKTYEDVSFQPNWLLANASDTTVFLLGIVWLMALIGFVVAGVCLLLQVEWWSHIALRAVITSLIPTILWHNDAVAGLVLNIVLLVALLAIRGWKASEHDSRRTLDIHRPSHA